MVHVTYHTMISCTSDQRIPNPPRAVKQMHASRPALIGQHFSTQVQQSFKEKSERAGPTAHDHACQRRHRNSPPKPRPNPPAQTQDASPPVSSSLQCCASSETPAAKAASETVIRFPGTSDRSGHHRRHSGVSGSSVTAARSFTRSVGTGKPATSNKLSLDLLPCGLYIILLLLYCCIVYCFTAL